MTKFIREDRETGERTEVTEQQVRDALARTAYSDINAVIRAITDDGQRAVTKVADYFTDDQSVETQTIGEIEAEEPYSDQPRRTITGITSIWVFGVRVWRDGDDLGVGDLNVQEVGVDGSIIGANFHPRGATGYGHVTNPKYRFEEEGHLNHPRHWLQ